MHSFKKWLWKHTESQLNEQSCLGGTAQQKLIIWRKIIPTKWDLTCVGTRSHVGGMNPFSYKRFVFISEIHNSAEISLMWDVSLGWDDFSHINSSLVCNYIIQLFFLGLSQFNSEASVALIVPLKSPWSKYKFKEAKASLDKCCTRVCGRICIFTYFSS